jgi:hypothetical protein
MIARFGQIFWGLLLAFVHIRINGVEILPNCIGYGLIAVGCGGLTAVSPCFSTARLLSWMLAVLSIVSWVLPAGDATALGILELIGNCSMMWFLLGGVMALATDRDRLDLFQRASNRRVAYAVLMSLVTIAGWSGLGSGDAAVVIALLLIFCVYALLCMILHLIYRVKKELA